MSKRVILSVYQAISLEDTRRGVGGDGEASTISVRPREMYCTLTQEQRHFARDSDGPEARVD